MPGRGGILGRLGAFDGAARRARKILVAWATAAGVLAAIGAPTQAKAQDKPTVVVLVTKGKGGPNLKSKVRKFIEKPLKSQANLVSFAKYKKAARKAKVKIRELYSVASVPAVAPGVGATHVVIIEGIMTKEGRKKIYSANVVIIAADTGNVLLTKSYPMARRNMAKAEGIAIAEEVGSALTTEPAEPVPEPEPEPAADPVVEAPPPPPVGPPPSEPGAEDPATPENPESPELAAVPLEGGASPEGAEPVAGGAEAAPVEGETAPPGPDPAAGPEVIEATPEGLSEMPVEDFAPANPGKRRPALRLGVGAIGMQREGVISAKDPKNVPPPCYCGEGGKSNPFFPAGYLRLEFFPLSINGDGSGIAEGIGLHAEAIYTQVKTVVDPATGKTVSSNVASFSGGLSFRFVFWDDILAPDLKVNAGASYSQFPLKQGVFPGVKYTGLGYAGLQLTFPVAVEELALIAGGSYTALVKPGGKTKRLGKKGTGFAYRAEGGVRIRFDPVEVHALVRWDDTRTTYKGATNLGTATEFRGASLQDRSLGGILTLGFTF